MGCCCPKQTISDTESIDERTRLLSSDQKSRFVDSNQPQSNPQLNQPQGSAFNSAFNYGQGYQQTDAYDSNQINPIYPPVSGHNNPLSHENVIIEKILSEVIHVSAFDQRSGIQSNDFQQITSDQFPVQDMPFKMKGLLEPSINRQQLSLPDGVPAPFSVLAAQPPFSEDIKLINKMAFEAVNCINNFTLNVPDNVAFDFKPVNL
ncbi:unnamed protein product [Brachionus calyciflorus]|uniref:Late endosomal/lysosomal adaptor and MAPK and MTOR activator 1 n=1 Tax=Brachionus calyciflorus TaxID=104777 RepID=A0A813VSC5_9BILA|nr:unnamed protein product [Brachionus calyciflorus]